MKQTMHNTLWVRSLLAVYRQAAVDATTSGGTSPAPEEHLLVLEDVIRFHALLAGQ